MASDKPGPSQSKTINFASGRVAIDADALCGSNVIIPPDLPDILKQYAKGAMRTQPPELLRWSGLYFRSLANGESLPVKDKVEYPVKENKDGLTPGIIKVLLKLLGGGTAPTDVVYKKWRGFGLSPKAFQEVLTKAGRAGAQQVDMTQLSAVMASTIGKNLKETMTMVCEIFTTQPDGTEPVMNYQTWLTIYTYLGLEVLKNQNAAAIDTLDNCLKLTVAKNGGMIGPMDFTSGACIIP